MRITVQSESRERTFFERKITFSLRETLPEEQPEKSFGNSFLKMSEMKTYSLVSKSKSSSYEYTR